MDNRGMSPLSSTIILLVVSILIGIVVMTWGRSFIEETTAQKAVEPVVPDNSVLQDLNARLEKGEINQQQYDKIKQVLVSGNS
ncbi:MAG TPA: hypothetical protein VKE88_02125 [Candidatus Nanoarchaeia archaeon]|nr:hypothetical protein [Candidatus Nanoarchaeia archaeon]